MYCFPFKKKIVLFSTIALLILIPFLLRSVIWRMAASGNAKFSGTDNKFSTAQVQIKREIAELDKKLDSKQPKSYFLVINTSLNEFVLRKGRQVIKKGKCSTGSYILLKNGEQQQWMFKTPKGEFRVQSKTVSPVWRKPDWVFIENGLPVPPLNHPSRFEYGVLGNYALSLGHGYLIHGTLYQRFIGMSVTHGCIRLNDENLELVFQTLQVGSKVFIY